MPLALELLPYFVVIGLSTAVTGAILLKDHVLVNCGFLRGSLYLRVSVAIVVVSAVLTYYWLVSFGGGTLLRTDPFLALFDALSDSLLRGESTVPKLYSQWESFSVGDRSYVYWGPSLALLRAIPNYLVPSFWGKWTQISTLLAGCLSLLGALFLLHTALARNSTLSSAKKYLTFLVGGCAYAFGSPILFLMVMPVAYHESMIWSVAAALWALYFFFLGSGTIRSAFAFAVLASFLFLTRLTVAFPFFLLAPVVLVRVWRTHATSLLRRCGAASVVMAPFLIALGVQALYNYDRWGSVATFVDYRYYFQEPDYVHDARERLGTFNSVRIGPALAEYFSLRKGYFKSSFPYLRSLPVLHQNKDPYFIGSFERIIGISLSSPWILLIWATGLWSLARSKEPTQLYCVAVLLIELVVLLSFFYISFRYQAEFLPLTACMFFVYARQLTPLLFNVTVAPLAVLTVAAAYTTFFGSLSWATTQLGVPLEFRMWIAQLFRSFS